MWPLVNVLIFITIYITLRTLWKSLFRQKPRPQPSSLSTLASSKSLVLRQPRDIILSIADHLPLESIAALSLTNKDLWLLLNANARLRDLSNNARAKEEFLQLIERELGHKYYYCHECTRLHPFKGDWALSRLEDDGGRKYQSLGPCFRKYGADMTMAGIHFPYPLARLVMNRHLYSPTHGLPLSALECEVRRFFRSSPPTSTPAVEWKVTWTARIWNNMLYMHSTHKLTHVRGPCDPKDLRKAVDGIQHRLCSHLQTHGGFDRHGRELRLKDRLWTVARHTDGTFVPCSNISGWCTECITDWETTIQPVEVLAWIQGRDTEYKLKSFRTFDVTVKTYHRLGDVRSPSSLEWRAFTGRARMVREFWFDYLWPGAVMEKWKRNERQ